MIKVIIFDFFGVLYDLNKKEINNDLIEIIKQLKNQNYKIAILSNMDIETLNKVENKFKIENLFDYIFTSGEIGFVKPQKEFFIYVLNNINLKAQECIFIDDGLENISTAKKLKFNVHHYENNENLLWYLKEKNIILK